MSLLCLKLPNGHHFSQNKSKKKHTKLARAFIFYQLPLGPHFPPLYSLLISAHDFLVQRFTYCSVWTIFPLIYPYGSPSHYFPLTSKTRHGFEKQPPLSYLSLGSEALLALRALVLHHPTKRKKNARSSWPRSGTSE